MCGVGVWAAGQALKAGWRGTDVETFENPLATKREDCNLPSVCSSF